MTPNLKPFKLQRCIVSNLKILSKSKKRVFEIRLTLASFLTIFSLYNSRTDDFIIFFVKLNRMKWDVYQMERERDMASQVGMKEKLTLFQINETVPSYTQLQLNMPPRVLDLGLYKLVFRFELITGLEDVKIFKESFTYINIVESPLKAVLMDGFPSKVSRGWAEEIGKSIF